MIIISMLLLLLLLIMIQVHGPEPGRVAGGRSHVEAPELYEPHGLRAAARLGRLPRPRGVLSSSRPR